MVEGLLCLLGFQLVGEWCVRALNWPVPGPVLGMALLLGYLMWRQQLPGFLQNTSSGLLSHLSLLFVPAGVGLLSHGPTLAREGWQMLLVMVLSTLITMSVTAAVLVLLLRNRKGRDHAG